MEGYKKVFTTITAACAVGFFLMEDTYADSYSKSEGASSLSVEDSGQDRSMFKATILLDGLNVRIDKVKSSESLGYFSKGEVVDVVSDEQDGWYGVKYGDGLGYIASNFVEKVDEDTSSDSSSDSKNVLDELFVVVDVGIPFVAGESSMSMRAIENSDILYYLENAYFSSNSFVINGFIYGGSLDSKDDLIMQFTLVDSTTGVTAQTFSVHLQEISGNLLFREKYDLDNFPIGEYFIHMQLVSGGGTVDGPVKVYGGLSEKFVGISNEYLLSGIEDGESYKLKIKIAEKNNGELESSIEDIEELNPFTALWDSVFEFVRRLIPFWN